MSSADKGPGPSEMFPGWAVCGHSGITGRNSLEDLGMKDAPAVVPEMEARHLAACQVERIATQVLGHLLAVYLDRRELSDTTVEAAVEHSYRAARRLAERFR